MKPRPPTTPPTVPPILVRVAIPGEHNGTIAWLAPGNYRMVYTIETNQTLVVPEDCISDVDDAPSFDSNITNITLLKPAVTRAIAVAPKKEAAQVAPKKQVRRPLRRRRLRPPKRRRHRTQHLLINFHDRQQAHTK